MVWWVAVIVLSDGYFHVHLSLVPCVSESHGIATFLLKSGRANRRNKYLTPTLIHALIHQEVVTAFPKVF